jgi:cytidylate kinase
MIVAIDGPAGAGKSSVSQEVARRLGFQLLDTGAIYRSVALMAKRAGVDEADGEAVAGIAARLRVRFEMRGTLNTVHAALDEDAFEEVTAQIRTPEVSQSASRTSAHPPVRAALLELQRRIGRAQPSVVEGRDIGTVVFPDAEVKVFLTASPLARAERRRAQLLASASDPASVPSLESIAAEIAERDERDQNRPVAPLRPAPDAVWVDSTGVSPDEVTAQIVALAQP